jgi:MurNAc alpha-1-phosphate uridylyltransferase
MSPLGDQVVILAGGLGTRMLPRTEAVPKFLLPVAGRPFAAWLLDKLAGAGFTEALICVGHLGEEIRRAVGDGSRFGLKARYADEGERLLGSRRSSSRTATRSSPSTTGRRSSISAPIPRQLAPWRSIETRNGSIGRTPLSRGHGSSGMKSDLATPPRIRRWITSTMERWPFGVK